GPGTLNNAVFAFERSQRIAGHAACITDGGVNAAARGAVSHGDVARLVHGDRTHPAERGVGRVGALLEAGRTRVRAAGFVTPHAHAASGRDRVVDYQRSVIAKVPVRQPVHQPVA